NYSTVSAPTVATTPQTSRCGSKARNAPAKPAPCSWPPHGDYPHTPSYAKPDTTTSPTSSRRAAPTATRSWPASAPAGCPNPTSATSNASSRSWKNSSPSSSRRCAASAPRLPVSGKPATRTLYDQITPSPVGVTGLYNPVPSRTVEHCCCWGAAFGLPRMRGGPRLDDRDRTGTVTGTRRPHLRRLSRHLAGVRAADPAARPGRRHSQPPGVRRGLDVAGRARLPGLPRLRAAAVREPPKPLGRTPRRHTVRRRGRDPHRADRHRAATPAHHDHLRQPDPAYGDRHSGVQRRGGALPGAARLRGRAARRARGRAAGAHRGGRGAAAPRRRDARGPGAGARGAGHDRGRGAARRAQAGFTPRPARAAPSRRHVRFLTRSSRKLVRVKEIRTHRALSPHAIRHQNYSTPALRLR